MNLRGNFCQFNLKILELTADILKMIEEDYQLKLDKESLVYYRLLVHIKFLVKRLIYSEKVVD